MWVTLWTWYKANCSFADSQMGKSDILSLAPDGLVC